MNDKTDGGVHWSFWTIGAVALIWNVMGVINLFVQMNADALAAFSETARALVEGRPAWATGAFAISQFGGALGCFLLRPAPRCGVNLQQWQNKVEQANRGTPLSRTGPAQDTSMAIRD